MYRDRLLPTVALALIDREEPAFAILDVNLRRERPAAEALRARRVPFGLATTGYNDSQPSDRRPASRFIDNLCSFAGKVWSLIGRPWPTGLTGARGGWSY
jgi:hypothetical protein